MDQPTQPFLPSTSHLLPPQTRPRTPTRSPTRFRLSVNDDSFADLTPSQTLEAFTHPSGRLKSSIESVSQTERAFGIRAAIASKNIQEWVNELEDWTWPAEGGSLGFEIPVAKRRKLSSNGHHASPNGERKLGELEYIGSLQAPKVLKYESRIEQIHTEMDELNVEEIKRQVLDTHFSPRSRPSSSASNAPPSLLSSYTRMDDFTAIVTATVLKALPNLSRLMRLMDVWSIRLNVLRKVPRLLQQLEEAEIALKSGWIAIQVPGHTNGDSNGDEALSRETFGIMQNVLQDKVTRLGQDLDYMLDTLEGREDTLPDAWLDRMEAIEHDYGEWAVAGDRKVREGEWAKMAKMRKEKEERRRLEEEAARLKAEKEAEELDFRRREDQAARLKAEREAQEAEDARLKAEQEAETEAARLKAEQETARLKAEKEAREVEAEAARLETERAAQAAEVIRLKAEQEAEAEAAKLEAERLAQEKESVRLKSIQDAAYAETAKRKVEELEVARINNKREAENARLFKAQQAAQETEALRLKEEQATADAELTRRKAEDFKAEKEAEVNRLLKEQQGAHGAEALRLKEEQAVLEVARRKAEKGAQAEAVRLKAENEAREAEAIRVREEQAAAEAETRQKAAREAKADVVRQRNEAMEAEALRVKVLQDAQDAEAAELAVRKAIEDAEAESAKLVADKLAKDDLNETKTEAAKSAEPHTVRLQELETEEQDHPQASSGDIAPAFGVSALVGVATAAVLTIESERFDHQITQSVYDEPSPSSPGCDCFDGGNDPRNEELQVVPEIFTREPVELTNRTPPDSANIQADLPQQSFEQKADNDTTSHEISHPPDDQPRVTIKSAEMDGAVDTLDSPWRPSNASPLTPDRPRSVNSSSRDDLNNVKVIPTYAPVLSTAAKSAEPDTKPTQLDTFNPFTQKELMEETWIVVDSTQHVAQEKFPNLDSVVDTAQNEAIQGKGHKKDLSVSSGYSTSDPTPEILEAQPAEYFRPILSPVKSARSSTIYSEPTTPKSPLSFSGLMTVGQVWPTLETPETPTKSPRRIKNSDEIQFPPSRASPVIEHSSEDIPDIVSGDGPHYSVPRDLELQEVRPPVLARKTSITRINSGPRRISILRRESVSSSGSTVINGQPGDLPSSPTRPSTPPFNRGSMDSFREVDDPSPSIRRHRNGKSHDYSSPDSPPPIPDLSGHRSIPRIRNSSLSSTSTVDTPMTSVETPFFDNVEVSTTPLSSPKKSNTDDQMQKQISSLLESIPARIRLTSEPDTNPSDRLVVKKTRPSLGTTFRSSSSMSTYSRAPTPSFTLAPAYGKGPSRQRPQNSNPEIKLYHLSRSTGEAPLKLLVRLVGEHGERVMVRVGGGWADLGEYLKEYASHHGRRAGVVDDGKVEIQDLPPRIVSTSSSTSTHTIRGNGRSSPMSRPSSAFDRPMSSLNIHKTRKSAGTGDLEPPSHPANYRSPSTPLPSTLTGAKYETPPSVASSSTSASTTASGNGGVYDRSSSRLSWTEEDSSLGLAGPKSKKVAISERDQEWVESMKEKVRLASAEKEKSKEKARGTSFGEMDRVGGTKRLFRKG